MQEAGVRALYDETSYVPDDPLNLVKRIYRAMAWAKPPDA